MNFTQRLDKTGKPIRALSLFSGGLDSILSCALMRKQGIDVVALTYETGYGPSFDASVKELDLGMYGKIERRVIDSVQPFLDIVKNPKHGFGGHLNPCIDCRIMMLHHAAELMKKEGFHFIITGEVIGQRPMSQRRDTINIVERESGIAGYLLRPLMAHCVKPTIPEEEGIVDREGLLGFNGRNRTPQLTLAKEFGITEFFSPGGGCLFTLDHFSLLATDLRDHNELEAKHVDLCRVGRHARLENADKLVLGRHYEDNVAIEKLLIKGDMTLVVANEVAGPTALLRGENIMDSLNNVASVVAGYSAAAKEDLVSVSWSIIGGESGTVLVKPTDKKTARKMFIYA